MPEQTSVPFFPTSHAKSACPCTREYALAATTIFAAHLPSALQNREQCSILWAPQKPCGLPISQPLTDPQIGRQNFTIGAHVAPDQYYFLGGLFTSGASIEWFRSLFGEDADYTTLISEASESPPGSLGVGFLPHLRFTNPPHAEAIARGTFIGLTPDANRGTLFRAILEGLSLETRLMIEASKSHPRRARNKKYRRNRRWHTQPTPHANQSHRPQPTHRPRRNG